MNLYNKIVVITGASDGIGKHIALSLGKCNTKLALIGRSNEKLDAVKEEALKNGAQEVVTYSCDITSYDALKGTTESILKDFGRVDVLINNAGIWQKFMPLDEIEEHLVTDVIMTNLTAQIQMTKLLLPSLRKSNEAAIMNIVSKSGVAIGPGQSVYASSKHGMKGFTDVLIEDLKETNIRVAGVYQAGTNTNMFANVGETMPLEKFSEPSDLANIVKFMLEQPPQIWIHDIRVQF